MVDPLSRSVGELFDVSCAEGFGRAEARLWVGAWRHMDKPADLTRAAAQVGGTESRTTGESKSLGTVTAVGWTAPTCLDACDIDAQGYPLTLPVGPSGMLVFTNIKGHCLARWEVLDLPGSLLCFVLGRSRPDLGIELHEEDRIRSLLLRPSGGSRGAPIRFVFDHLGVRAMAVDALAELDAWMSLNLFDTSHDLDETKG